MKLICIGRNYVDHIDELKNEKPSSPVIFLKPDSAVILKNHPFFIPDYSNDVHYEVEVLIKIKKLGKSIDVKFSHTYYDEIGLGIDFTARDLQSELKKNGLPWEKSKAFDGSALIGKWVNKNEFNDLNNLNFSLKKNGTIVQFGNTSNMLWFIDELISEVSKFFTLKIGDVIFTGTPSGVGKVSENDLFEGFINEKQFFSIKSK
ncbi:MAG: fumarylacetoacetate hydrolase family protein [Flavobacteriaceae bacterium]|jgi:2-keto-4-pentenoate hydratase/2-oxohepta-3-ene-1,7-dioic acid hydratase in catechol pathway|nr:fumarylacetoacetate hydrolase family protein [Flavobacteriaceae bacterium]MBT4063247.1 fumarylacetoacetate hydrolase family protein [Flavobacteriaceae bacterium]MBT4246439.1 fumarylacetoacetate hydrolase family protein [Flavobacteriaceae bacterium]MBT4416091.1 fumarylacetoacetate hydrolase family protein [Flavobacteriaceae bacterium]MBT5011871.1 fumarylacetoacetate hydrolase family protein [Flavobacteriaceae bacterium]|tara:strand:- start:1320 stop:1931 length:612 start_codon:yes stop_codon:yes gene_type:complete